MASVSMVDVERLLDSARDSLTVKRVYGEPIECDAVRVIPAAQIRGGAGGGGGTGPGADEAQGGGGSGGGFGVNARPAGAFVVKDGDVRWQPAVNRERVAIAGMVLAAVIALVVRSILKGLFREVGHRRD